MKTRTESFVGVVCLLIVAAAVMLLFAGCGAGSSPGAREEHPKVVEQTTAAEEPGAAMAPPVRAKGPPSAYSGFTIPAFPWPPAPPSDRIKLQDELLRRATSQSLGDVDKLLTDALSKTGQFERSYFSAPGGFALVTRLEQINPDGSPKAGDDRWVTTPGPLRKFTLDAYLKALFGSAPGYFRVIVFTVIDQPFSVTGKPINEGDAICWLEKGLDRLPEEIAALPYTAKHSCTALIYEFETSGGPDAPTVIRPGRLGGLVHLQKLGILQYLQTP